MGGWSWYAAGNDPSAAWPTVASGFLPGDLQLVLSGHLQALHKALGIAHLSGQLRDLGVQPVQMGTSVPFTFARMLQQVSGHRHRLHAATPAGSGGPGDRQIAVVVPVNRHAMRSIIDQ